MSNYWGYEPNIEQIGRVNQPPAQYVTAWHCGSKATNDPFDFAYYRTGEGYDRPPLGPGIYFHQSKGQAAAYCHHVYRKNKSPYMCYATLDTSNMMGCDDNGCINDHVNQRLLSLLGREFPNRKISGWYTGVRNLISRYGAERARDLLVAAGISGYFEPVTGGFEYAVYDLNAIQEISCEAAPMGNHAWLNQMHMQSYIDNYIFQTGELPDARPDLMKNIDRFANRKKKPHYLHELRRNPDEKLSDLKRQFASEPGDGDLAGRLIVGLRRAGEEIPYELWRQFENYTLSQHGYTNKKSQAKVDAILSVLRLRNDAPELFVETIGDWEDLVGRIYEARTNENLSAGNERDMLLELVGWIESGWRVPHNQRVNRQHTPNGDTYDEVIMQLAQRMRIHMASGFYDGKDPSMYRKGDSGTGGYHYIIALNQFRELVYIAAWEYIRNNGMDDRIQTLYKKRIRHYIPALEVRNDYG